MNVGTHIRILRESNNMSREMLADKLDLSPNTVYKMEVGERVPTLDDLKVISEEFKVDPSIFFTNSESTYIQNGEKSPGIYGSINSNYKVGVNEELLQSLVETLDKLTDFLKESE